MAPGYTLIEILVVLIIVAVGLSLAVTSFGVYQARTSARSAAQLFARDLAQARSWARRTNEGVTVRFHEAPTDLRYELVSEGGDTLVLRGFFGGGEVRLDSLDLGMMGDSLRFAPSGIADLSTAQPAGATASARFHAGNRSFRVRFNSTGASVIEVGS